VNIFGDMGVYSWNNMANMAKDLQDESAGTVTPTPTPPHCDAHCNPSLCLWGQISSFTWEITLTTRVRTTNAVLMGTANPTPTAL